jgi:hypothetical protein
VEVDGVLAGDNVGNGGAASLLSGGSHFKGFQCVSKTFFAIRFLSEKRLGC